jgi:hypothetical protein
VSGLKSALRGGSGYGVTMTAVWSFTGPSRPEGRSGSSLE